MYQIMLWGWFPSPLGVIFSLINDVPATYPYNTEMFPSPLGVIFSLIRLSKEKG